MTCGVVTPGMLQIVESTLGTLDLSRVDGFVTFTLEVGAPAERPVVRSRALNDGVIDETQYVGGRAITLSMRLDTSLLPMQTLLDKLTPYLSPRYRPTLRWSLPETPDQVRALTVRGVGLPIAIAAPKYPGVVASFLSPDAFLAGGQRKCHTLVPSELGVVADGRVYDLSFDRDYPFAAPVGAFTISNAGTAPTDWQATIFGPVTNPLVQINGVTVELTLDLLAGQILVIDTLNRTMLFNSEPSEPRYQFSNFLMWSWEQIRLQPGDNQVRFDADVLDVASAFTICWYDRWL